MQVNCNVNDIIIQTYYQVLSITFHIYMQVTDSTFYKTMFYCVFTRLYEHELL